MGGLVEAGGGTPVILDPDLSASLATKEDKSHKGATGGYASLDSSGKIPPEQLPPGGGTGSGSTGSTGATGKTGATGGTGSTGATGGTGSTGATGKMGATGPAGGGTGAGTSWHDGDGPPSSVTTKASVILGGTGASGYKVEANATGPSGNGKQVTVIYGATMGYSFTTSPLFSDTLNSMYGNVSITLIGAVGPGIQFDYTFQSGESLSVSDPNQESGNTTVTFVAGTTTLNELIEAINAKEGCPFRAELPYGMNGSSVLYLPQGDDPLSAYCSGGGAFTKPDFVKTDFTDPNANLVITKIPYFAISFSYVKFVASSSLAVVNGGGGMFIEVDFIDATTTASEVVEAINNSGFATAALADNSNGSGLVEANDSLAWINGDPLPTLQGENNIDLILWSRENVEHQDALCSHCTIDPSGDNNALYWWRKDDYSQTSSYNIGYQDGQEVEGLTFWDYGGPSGGEMIVQWADVAPTASEVIAALAQSDYGTYWGASLVGDDDGSGQISQSNHWGNMLGGGQAGQNTVPGLLVSAIPDIVAAVPEVAAKFTVTLEGDGSGYLVSQSEVPLSGGINQTLPYPDTSQDGDYYLDTSNADVYKRVNGTYAYLMSLKGATGATGPS